MALPVGVIEPVDLVAVDLKAMLGLQIEFNPGVDCVDDLPHGHLVLVIGGDGVELMRVVAGVSGCGHWSVRGVGVLVRPAGRGEPL